MSPIPDHQHLCAVCGEWGPYGVKAKPGDLTAPYRWYCARHRPPPPAVPKPDPAPPAASGRPRQGKLL